MSESGPAIVWFRQDLRLADNPALDVAAALEVPILPVYVLDDDSSGEFRMGAASRWWLHRSLSSLNADLDGGLRCLRGRADLLLPRLAREVDAVGVFWNRSYEPWRIERDKRIKRELLNAGHLVRSFNGSLLFEPPHVTKQDGTPYRVFTPYYNIGCLKEGIPPRKPLATPSGLDFYPGDPENGLESLDLASPVRHYDAMDAEWTPGERGADERMARFLDSGIRDYTTMRDRPDLRNVSRLSPHLHFGEISPHMLWHEANRLVDFAELADDIDNFKRQLGWREFCHYLLYYQPRMPLENLQKKFDRFPWRSDQEDLERWRAGQTGYPIVDAGMRELWQTGYMHNRVRMIVGSFLVKNLLLDWRLGAAWFWDTLADADLANNSAGWQWIAGCGADAAPYFRIFNPVTQGRKFDPDGSYVRRYVPEIGSLPDAYLHAPWEAGDTLLEDAGIRLDDDYPAPMVDLKESRERALAALNSLKT